MSSQLTDVLVQADLRVARRGIGRSTLRANKLCARLLSTNQTSSANSFLYRPNNFGEQLSSAHAIGGGCSSPRDLLLSDVFHESRALPSTNPLLTG